ncbi:uncharacterized protein LOC143202018 [Rhynchophorus ferrugineus]|uniref:Uncharacterized protein n=1 Tax=Rhynchophorus ferrugineus TaxID=354439 RepID=A0A834HXQ3_RHYFE|nr:hypothetical protein GWI33_019739 [Rhynchophorus ferrugineus]
MVLVFKLSCSIILSSLVIIAKTKPILQEIRLSLAEPSSYNIYEPNGPGTYAFGYEIDDPETENLQFRDEERHANGTVTGRYGWMSPDGKIVIAEYISDKNGYRAKVETLPNFRTYRDRRFKAQPNNFAFR